MNWLTWLLTWIFLCYPGLGLVDLICFGGYRFHVRYRPSDSSLVQVDRQHQAWLVVGMIAKSFCKFNLKIQGKVRGKILILDSKLLWSISDHQTMKIFSKYTWWYNGMEPIAYLSHPSILGVTLCFCTGSYAAAAAAGRRFLFTR